MVTMAVAEKQRAARFGSAKMEDRQMQLEANGDCLWGKGRDRRL